MPLRPRFVSSASWSMEYCLYLPPYVSQSNALQPSFLFLSVLCPSKHLKMSQSLIIVLIVLLLSTISAPATPQVATTAHPPSTFTSAHRPVATEVAVPNDPPLEVPNPGPDDNLPDTTPDDSTIVDVLLEGSDPTVNTANLLYYLDDSSVTYKIGLQVTFYDAVSEKEEGVQFFTSGAPFWCGYVFFKKHTNSDGFWEDNNIFDSTAGLNIGYNPTSKTFNFAGHTRLTDFDAATGQAKCQYVFEFSAGGDSFRAVHEDGGGDQSIPPLLTFNSA